MNIVLDIQWITGLIIGFVTYEAICVVLSRKEFDKASDQLELYLQDKSVSLTAKKQAFSTYRIFGSFWGLFILPLLTVWIFIVSIVGNKTPAVMSSNDANQTYDRFAFLLFDYFLCRFKLEALFSVALSALLFIGLSLAWGAVALIISLFKADYLSKTLGAFDKVRFKELARYKLFG